MEGKSKMYGKAFFMNACTIYLYKSSRKNAKIISDIHINHLITQTEDRKVQDKTILSQFVGVLEKAVSDIGINGHIEVSVYMDAGKDAIYENANNDSFLGVGDIQYNWQRVTFCTIEGFINFLFSVFCILYPYNKISLSHTLYNDPSIMYWISKYYGRED